MTYHTIRASFLQNRLLIHASLAVHIVFDSVSLTESLISPRLSLDHFRHQLVREHEVFDDFFRKTNPGVQSNFVK